MLLVVYCSKSKDQVYLCFTKSGIEEFFRVTRSCKRTPKGYNGSDTTTHQLDDLLPYVLHKIGKQIQQKSKMILEVWPQIVGPQIAPMAKAHRFFDKVLYVHVTNSILLSLLHTIAEKKRLCKAIEDSLPGVEISDIVFKIG